MPLLCATNHQAFVTADVPRDADLETLLETGIWTWSWMEPPMGTLRYAHRINYDVERDIFSFLFLSLLLTF